MRITGLSLPVLLFGLAGCNQSAPEPPQANEAAPPHPAPVVNETSNVALPDDRTPLEEPKGPIDPKSAEAAGQVVQHYAALIEQGRWSEASAYWGDAARAARFRSELAGYAEVHMEIGKPGDSEGAAGSIYTTVPVIFYGEQKSGADSRRAADVVLRRVNDVPGSTEAQRRWHIERIEWKTKA